MLNYSGNTAAEYNNIFFRHIFTQFQDLPGQVLTCTWDPGITHYPRITHYAAAAWLITEMLPLHLCPVDSSYHIQHGIVVTDFAVYTTRYDCHCRISWRYSQGCVATRFNRIRVLLLDNDLGKQKKRPRHKLKLATNLFTRRKHAVVPTTRLLSDGFTAGSRMRVKHVLIYL